MFVINRIRMLSLAAFIVFVASSAQGQVVIYDWSVKGDAPKSYPTITRREAVTIRIENVNDILFSYRMRVTQRRLDTSDFDVIAKLLIKQTPPAPGIDATAVSCTNLNKILETALKEAIGAISDDVKLPIGYAAQTSHGSVPLKDSLDAWRSHAPAIEAVNVAYRAAIRACSSTPHESEYRKFIDAVDKIRQKINRPHLIEESHTLDAGSHVTVIVDEIYEGDTVSSATFAFDTEDVLTLSAGAMFSQIQDRAYEARKDPTSTLNTLTVTGNSRATPSLVALLNYSLGALHLDWDRLGFALSAGPVLRVGGQADTSSFGFFTGISGHLYRRIFFTPGFHFGQFADFPVGFGNGSSVPENFGELTPVKRWTGRFGLAITFKTKTFDAFGSEDKKIGGDEAGGETKAKEEKKPDEEENTSNSRMILGPSTLRSVRSRTPSQSEVPIVPQRSDIATVAGESDPSTSVPQDSRSDTSGTPVYVSGSSAEPLTRIISIKAISIAVAADERVSIETSARINDYSMYFRAGRFYLVLPRIRLNGLQDGLQGHFFSEALIEKRGSDLLISFVLKPGTSARVVEQVTGLDLVFASSSPNQE